jgi:hypothetical protein
VVHRLLKPRPIALLAALTLAAALAAAPANVSANALGLDSDPSTNVPHHDVGDSFKLTFPQPGTYAFHCKLHAFVGGVVVVSNTPGDPITEPDPIPPNNVDLTRPRMSELRLVRRRFGRGGTVLRVTLDTRAIVDAEIYRIWRGRHGRLRRRYAGWRQWRGHIGYNYLGFGRRSKHFRGRPGRYRAIVTATDKSNNVSRARRLGFRIVKLRRRARRR